MPGTIPPHYASVSLGSNPTGFRLTDTEIGVLNSRHQLIIHDARHFEKIIESS